MNISLNTINFKTTFKTPKNNFNKNKDFGMKSNYIVYMKTDDMLYSGGSGNGLSFTVKYAENSTKENPLVVARGVDEKGKEFEKLININDIDPSKASIIEMRALENHLKLDKGNWLSTLPHKSSHMGLNDRGDFFHMFEDAIKEQVTLRQYDLAMRYRKNLDAFIDFARKNEY